MTKRRLTITIDINDDPPGCAPQGTAVLWALGALVSDAVSIIDMEDGQRWKRSDFYDEEDDFDLKPRVRVAAKWSAPK
jgi:hypothetical protein